MPPLKSVGTMCHVNDSVIASARQASNLLKGQVLGQVTILETPYGIVEMKDALRKNVGGEVLCFAY